MRVIENSFIYHVLSILIFIPFALVCIIILIGVIFTYPLAIISAIKDNEKIHKRYKEMIKDFFNIS